MWGLGVSHKVLGLNGIYAQMLADPDHPSMFTSLTNDYWRTVRKGLAPAFNTANIRYDDQLGCAKCPAETIQSLQCLPSDDPR